MKYFLAYLGSSVKIIVKESFTHYLSFLLQVDSREHITTSLLRRKLVTG